MRRWQPTLRYVSSNMSEQELVPLIDTDIFRFRCGFAADYQIKKEAQLHYPDASDTEIAEILAETDYVHMALQNVKTVFEALQDRFGENYLAYIHKGGNFRYDIATIKPYKGNRDKTHKPKYFNEISDYIVGKWKAIEVEGIESDDAIGIKQSTSPWGTTVICSNDKDMKQIAGHHFNWVKNEFETVSPEDADLMFFWQMLVGDASDNIPGINQVGPKRADAILKDCNYDISRIRNEVQKLYAKQYGGEWRNAYNEVGALLYIHRSPDDLEKGCPLL